MPKEVTLSSRGAAARLRRAIRKVARDALTQIGKWVAEDGREAFRAQAFAGVAWPKKYQGIASSPFINVAGALADFSSGRSTPRKESFLDRPAGIHSGALQRSVAWKLRGDDAVEIGSPLSYATPFHVGGTVVAPITEDAKERISDWLGSTKRTVTVSRDDAGWRKRAKYGDRWENAPDDVIDAWAKSHEMERKETKRPAADVRFTAPSPYAKALKPLLDEEELVTHMHRRPFIGITESRATEMAGLLEAGIAKAGSS